MPVWETQPVAVQPELSLVRWRIIETENGERHFVGYCPENREGRVSSAIQVFDPRTLRGITESGRIYELTGPGGFDNDADYTLAAWVRINGIERVEDVTAEVLAAHPQESCPLTQPPGELA